MEALGLPRGRGLSPPAVRHKYTRVSRERGLWVSRVHPQARTSNGSHREASWSVRLLLFSHFTHHKNQRSCKLNNNRKSNLGAPATLPSSSRSLSSTPSVLVTVTKPGASHRGSISCAHSSKRTRIVTTWRGGNNNRKSIRWPVWPHRVAPACWAAPLTCWSR